MIFKPAGCSAVSLVCCLCLGSSAHAIGVSGQGTWETTLQARDLDSNSTTVEAYYDTSLNITWLADANYAYTSHYDADGIMTWDQSIAWIAGLNATQYLELHNWRLPNVNQSFGPTCGLDANAFSGGLCGHNVNPLSSELAYMYHSTLGNLSSIDTQGNLQDGGGLTNTGPFIALMDGVYWSMDESMSDATRAWGFDMGVGYQVEFDKATLFPWGNYAWAIHDGDVGTPVASAVPLPAAACLLGSGLIGLLGFSKRSKAA